MILESLEKAFKDAIIDKGYEGSIRCFFVDDTEGDIEAKELPCIVIVANPYTYENNSRNFKLVPVNITAITHPTDDKKRQALKDMTGIILDIIDEDELNSDDINIRAIMNEGGNSFIEVREQGVSFNLNIKVSACG
ncbi:hypothetical protein P0Y35_11795 [Kiritimatiellaeota bacterium B1221]|nr:hypothetical protein [Kiritimatiellaeota bacterium B1221]